MAEEYGLGKVMVQLKEQNREHAEAAKKNMFEPVSAGVDVKDDVVDEPAVAGARAGWLDS